jgi:hypothetical protein
LSFDITRGIESTQVIWNLFFAIFMGWRALLVASGL